MQTFLPYQDFQKSLACLDYKRLGKQRVEALQILNTLTGKSQGWKNHPAVRMWRHYETALEVYKNVAISVWAGKGYNNSMPLTYNYSSPIMLAMAMENCFTYLPWTTPKFCSSHRSNLLRKDYVFYSKYGWTEPTNLPYIWPV